MEAKNSTEKTIIEENNKISIIININHIKIKYIKFTLFEKIKSDRNLIQDLLDEINNLKNNTEEKFIKLEKDNKNLKDEIFLLKEENKKLYENYNLLLKDIKEIKGKNNSINQYSQYNQDLLYLSSILNSDINGTNKIKSWIKEKTNKDSLTFKLIFRMSENGYKGSDFHKYCDIEEPTLILIKSKCNNIFGGFTPLSWGKETYPIDKSNQTFIFSLNRNNKFEMINKTNFAIRCFQYEGPVFGDCDIKLGDNLKKIESYATSSSCYFSTNSLELTGEKGEYQKLETQELEVFKVIY